MKKLILFTVVAVLLCSCRDKALTGVSFPEPPIEIAANTDYGMSLINYFNIIQIPDGTYRMYFAGIENGDKEGGEWVQNLYLAESVDGFHYNLKCKIMDSIIEQSVCMVADKAWPYRLVGNQMDDGKHCMFLWKSKDGIEFTGRKLLFDDKHDTQNVFVPRGRRMKLYSRKTLENFRNRRMTVTEFTINGGQLSVPEILAGDFLYNNAATKVDKRYDLLFPTYYNTYGGTSYACFFRCYLVDGPFIRELPCALNRWVDANEGWVLASPGFIYIDGERYLAFATRTATHDHGNKDMISKFKLIKTVLEYQ